MNNTSLMEKVDSNTTPNSSDMYDNEFKDDQNADDHEDEHVVLADLIANLKLDIDENKKIQKQLRNANTSLAQELKECKSTLEETNRTLGESNRTRDRCFVALHDKEIELAMYKTFKDHTIENDTLERKLKETQASLAQKEHDIKEGLKLKAYENSVVKEKHDELVKQSLLTKSHYEGLVREKTKVITDLKQKEEKDLDKLIAKEKQLTFLNKIVYKRNQSIQTIHMLAPKGSTFNGKPTFANPMYLKKAQSKKPCLYEIPYDTSDLANRFIPDREETLTLEQESRFRAPTALDMEVLIKTCLIPLALKTQNDSFIFVHELKQEMHADLKYVESLEKEIDDLESDKAEFSNMYDLLLQECMSNDVLCSYLHSLSGLNAHTELQCLYLHKVKECECFAQNLSKKPETICKDVYNELSRHFAKLEKHSISLKLALQHCQDQMTQEKVSKVTASNVFQKERGQYHEIQDLKAQLQDKNIAISELKKLIENVKGSNDMVHNYYLEEAKKKAQLQKDKALNTKPSVQQSAKSPNTANGNKLKPRNFTQQPRNWPPSMSSCVSNRTIKMAEPPRNQKPFLKSKDLACPTCKKCIYSANHDECILKYLSKVNSRAPT
ncbi:hypothetical protein Tco_0894738 [Tanacetum coccineum]|uniref:Uncharacterized protein n=1 Tax=Tanacetum coccineum TaxID=301880 RepID=A0ABQ5CCJ9_9ASTR